MSNKKKLSTPQLRKSLESELGDLDEQLEKINALYAFANLVNLCAYLLGLEKKEAILLWRNRVINGERAMELLI